jgi:hypothetical protein
VARAAWSFLVDCLRWLCVSAIAYFGCVAYAILLVACLRFISPRFVTIQLGIEGESEPLSILWESFILGSYAGLVLGPFIGFSALKDVNESAEHPGEEANWWRRSHKYLFWALVSVAGLSLVAGCFILVMRLAQGQEFKAARYYACHGLVWGSVAGAGLFAFGRLLSSRSTE